MNTRLFLAIISLFIAVFSAKGQSTSPADLKTGDWMELEYITFLRDSTPGDMWRAEDILKIRFRGTVIRKTENDLTLSFKPIHLYRHYIYPSGDAYSYTDSYFKGTDVLFKHDSLVFSLQLPANIPHDTVFVLQNNAWQCFSQSMSYGIRNQSSANYGSLLIGNVRAIFHNAVMGYFHQWKNYSDRHQEIPQTVELNDTIPGFTLSYAQDMGLYRHNFPKLKFCPLVRLVESSSGMKTNVHLIYRNPENLQNPLSFTVSGQKHTFSQKNNELECRFYLSSPAKTEINGVPLWLMPGDSIVFEKDGRNGYLFSGKGAANCMFAQEEQNLLPKNKTAYDIEKYQTSIEEMSEIYLMLWEKYGKQMDYYWLKSSQFTYKYWYMVSYLAKYGTWQISQKSENRIFGDDPQFATATPYFDYYYQPDHYENFIISIFIDKLNQLRNDNMTAFFGRTMGDLEKGEQFENIEKSFYYNVKFLYSGYPQLLLMKDFLKNIMRRYHYSTYRPEYEDFMQTCLEPELRREISDLHRQLMQIEPGRKIQDINPELSKLPFLKNKADGYIVLSIGKRYMKWGMEWTSHLWKELEKVGLSEQMKVIAFRSMEYVESLPDSLKNPDKYLYLTDMDMDFFSFIEGEFFLLRNDGTIVSRNSYFGNFYHLVDIIRADMEERDRKPEKSGNILQVILISFIVGFVIAFISIFYIKIVKMREYNKRRMTELELKAIRSQMNPHFVFNALGSIQSLINQEKTADANQYLVNFAKLLRMALSSADKKLTSLADELEQLELYLRLEQLRVPFVYNISVESNIHPVNEEIPGMLIQPIVENAVIHGIVPQSGGNIDIRVGKEENILSVEVADDGAGISDDDMQKNGFGIRAINERISLLNNNRKAGIGLKFENRQAKEGVSGTRVTILIEN